MANLRALPGGKTLPHNLQAEASILGGIIIQPSVLAELDALEPGAFYDLKHKVVFTAMRNLEAAGTPIDVTTLETEIERQGKLDAIGGGAAFLGELALKVPTVDHVLHYAKIVRDHQLLRDLALKMSRAVERVYDWEHEADELLGETMADLAQLEGRYRDASETLPTITIDGALADLDRLARTPVFATPFPALNKVIGFDGLLGGQVYYLAGGTGFGKTSFIAKMVRGHAEGGRPALIAFYEMFPGYYVARMAAEVLGVHANRIIRGEVDHDAIRGALPKGIEMLDAPSMATIRRTAERYVKAGRGAPLIVVDYVQLLGDKIMATQARPDPRIANSLASAGLRDLAKATGAAVICVSAAGRSASRQLNKDVRKAPARDLIDASRESGSIEFDGAGVIVLSVSDELDGDERIATVSVAKARFGETAHIDARYDGRSGAWRTLDRVTKVVDLHTKPDDGVVRKAVIDCLRKHPEGISKTKIAAETGKNKTAVLSEVDIMIEAGIAVYKGRGYALAQIVGEPVQTGFGTGPEPVPSMLAAALAEVEP